MKCGTSTLESYHNLHVLIDSNSLPPIFSVSQRLFISTLLFCGLVNVLIKLYLRYWIITTNILHIFSPILLQWIYIWENVFCFFPRYVVTFMNNFKTSKNFLRYMINFCSSKLRKYYSTSPWSGKPWFFFSNFFNTLKH